MLKRIQIIIVILEIIYISSCQRSTEPLINNPGPDTTSHNFTWTADTIYAEDAYQIYLYDIWGTDENNVWAVGHSEKLRYRIWHYDGKTWSNVYVPAFYHVPTYREIFGFGENDFWIVGYGVKTNIDSAVGYILHYDGEWRRMDNYDQNQMAGIEEAEKKGNKPDFIAHIIAKYDGKTVYEVSTGGFVSKNPLFKFEFKGAKKGEKFDLTATDNNGKSTTKKIKIK